MDDVAEAIAAVKQDLIGKLPKMRRDGAGPTSAICRCLSTS
jgi:hypothetical protein